MAIFNSFLYVYQRLLTLTILTGEGFEGSDHDGSALCCPGDSSGGHPRFCCATQTRFWPGRLEVHTGAQKKSSSMICVASCCI